MILIVLVSASGWYEWSSHKPWWRSDFSAQCPAIHFLARYYPVRGWWKGGNNPKYHNRRCQWMTGIVVSLENSLEVALCWCTQPGVAGTATPEGDQENTWGTPARLWGNEESKHRQEGQPLPSPPGRWELNPGRNTLGHQSTKNWAWDQTLGQGWVRTQGLKMEEFGGILCV